MKYRKIPICLKRTIMDTVILPTMTYGAETRALTKHREKKLAVAQRSMKRLLLSITKRNKIRNEVIRCKTGVKDVIECAVHERTVGRTARMSNTRWAKITSEWTPREGKLVRGRPKRRWKDNIEDVGSTQWMGVAQNRNAWHELWRPSASSGMND